MFSILLAIIYMSFISLGLPDSLLGSGWPVMHQELGAPISLAGVITMIIAGGTIVSSLLSDRLTRRFGAGLVTAVSVGMTAMALFGFSASSSILQMYLWAIPYGLGAGAVDAALNNFVALHYAARHMSWLHCFWGVGVSVSPFIMGYCLSEDYGWQMGYRTVFVIQIVLTAMLFASLPLWKKKQAEYNDSENAVEAVALGVVGALKIKGVKYVLVSFFCYCALESTAGLWASSYLVESRGVDAETAALFASLFYLGITFGRLINGFVADKLGDKTLIRIGIGTIIAGIVMVGIPLKTDILVLCGLVVIGIGCAPVYPSVIHATPSNFGRENSQAIVGIQMASAYVGTTLMPPLFGLIADNINIGFYPVFLLAIAVLMLAMTELLNKTMKDKEKIK
ncbi:MAG: MFS transporter [Clostridia bacterium]|nr:MFS transporter [Clostridia bacterium]